MNNNAFILKLRRINRQKQDVIPMQNKTNEEKKRPNGEKIDEEFLARNHQIRIAFARAKIDTYPQLYAKAKAEYNLYYLHGLSAKLIKKIQQHLLITGRRGLPDYEKNLKDKPAAERKRARTERKLSERIYLKLRAHIKPENQ